MNIAAPNQLIRNRTVAEIEEPTAQAFTDSVNEFTAKARSADGFIFGTPVHHASAGGAITSPMDRVFFSDRCAVNNSFYLKPAATVAVARRAGIKAGVAFPAKEEENIFTNFIR